jgi:uncharacterized protein (TIGR02145 family)
VGTAYGDEYNFTTESQTPGWGPPCPGMPTVTDIDGHIYHTVQIGMQCWMKENLKVTKNPAGSPITRNCYFNNEENCDWYGGLYTWETVMNGAVSSHTNPSGVQGICPAGWHLPSHSEWTQLEQHVCNTLGNSDCEAKFPDNIYSTGLRGTNEGNALKSCRQYESPLGGSCNTSEHPYWNGSFTNYGTDDFGFSGLPGGSYYAGLYSKRTMEGYCWSSSQINSQKAWFRALMYNNGQISRNTTYKTAFYNVRCIKD